MRKARPDKKHIIDDRGQAVVEYLLGLVIAVSLVAGIAGVLRSSLFGLWQNFSREITAACPGCPADPSIRLK